ncbi:hypothetical protein PC114_g14668 [Phytophthora cactorum]|uniref:Uncharacterized protein n=1 Tax=Phytophthora cactorum TaxID=29920 RepID=A0A8T1CUI7_9STRA|nr:hypothetical protein PC112_g13607 [Phytophthora cactorum]KAG2897402.1 hypothetical protein PC114_g14668 [Phytophthora cactorum]KAG2928519.1 hypothetical protein PC117_g14284 [Phytophthora cactorum]
MSFVEYDSSLPRMRSGFDSPTAQLLPAVAAHCGTLHLLLAATGPSRTSYCMWVRILGLTTI